jgi:hypothetical protein
MKKYVFLISLIVIVLSISSWLRGTGANESTGIELEASESFNPPMYLDRIKNASVLIVARSIHADRITLGYDMGTLVHYQGETYLVTHNHYGEMLQDSNLLELYDAENHRIRSISGFEFKSLIVYQDPGTLVLRAPYGLTDMLTPVSLDLQPQLQPGDIVQVAYRGGAKREQVEIVDAVIEEITVSGVTPVYRLRFPNGPLLSPGDSGGGVWYGESFVGNTWSIVLSYTVAATSGASNLVNETQTNSSYAALFPEAFR